jgi:hypothetical protein
VYDSRQDEDRESWAITVDFSRGDLGSLAMRNQVTVAVMQNEVAAEIV